MGDHTPDKLFPAVLGQKPANAAEPLLVPEPGAEPDSRDELYNKSQWSIYGPNGRAVCAFLDAYEALTDAEEEAFESAQATLRTDASDHVASASLAAAAAARKADRHNELAAVDEATIQRYGIAASGPWDVAYALVARDLISNEDFEVLTRAWRETFGELPPGLKWVPS